MRVSDGRDDYYGFDAIDPPPWAPLRWGSGERRSGRARPFAGELRTEQAQPSGRSRLSPETRDRLAVAGVAVFAAMRELLAATEDAWREWLQSPPPAAAAPSVFDDHEASRAPAGRRGPGWPGGHDLWDEGDDPFAIVVTDGDARENQGGGGKGERD